MQETTEKQVQSLGQEGPLEQEMATHSSILAWRIPWTEDPGGLQSIWSQRVRQMKQSILLFFFLTASVYHCTGSLGWENRHEKQVKIIHIGKEKLKLSLFADDIIQYIDSSKEYTTTV